MNALHFSYHEQYALGVKKKDLMAPLVSLIVNILVINKSLSRTALSLIRNEQKLLLKQDVSYIEVCAIDRMLRIIRMEKETLKDFSGQAV
ncbi:MAG: hypothetical protein K6E50_08145 [Lachnospiraceae bacterium]|nr:hypothetical protein [Lachnospiraceae bacterium]